ncbi:MAG: hypothetical protein K0Q72_3414, partial [Armatimonadetes bacterium]|nr:hypothetical protein [Armatimonadota bacterium]
GLPPLPPIATGAPAPPAPPAAPGAPPVVAPVLPPADAALQPGAPSAEGILKMLDFIRALPEDRYQAEKPKLSLGIAQMLALAAKSGAADAANGRGEAVGKDLQLALGPQGAVLGLTVFGELLSTLGEKPGGISVQAEGQPEIPIRGPLTAEGDARRFRIENPEGAVSMLVKPGTSDLTVKVVGRRGKAGGPAFLNLSIPVRLGGWYWQAGAERQPITMDRSYQLAAAEGKLPSLVVGSGAAEVTVEAVTASDLAYLPREGRLRIRLPLTNEAGTAEHTVRLSAARRP